MPILSILKGKSRWALALGLFSMFLAVPCSAKDDPLAAMNTVTLSYAIYVGGLHLMDSTAGFTRSGADYHVSMKTGTQGLLRAVAPWDAEMNSSGIIKDDAVQPSKGVIVTRWKNDPATVEFDYENGKEVKTIFSPVPDMSKNEDVPEAMRQNSLDPLNGIVQMMAGFAYGKGCAQSVPIFDGHRRFDVNLQDGGGEKLAGGDYSIYSGASQKCEVTFAMKAGSRKDREGSHFWEDGKNGGTRPPIYIYLAKIRPDLPPIPVRAETDTFFGGVMIHLVALNGGAQKTAAR